MNASVGPNPIHPDRLTAKERIAELCRVLAVGLVRMRIRETAAKSTELSARVGESSLHSSAEQSGHATQSLKERSMTDTIPARLAALKTASTKELKRQWRDLFDSEPPPFNRRYLESRLAYRIQELAYGGLKPETIRRLERLGEDLDGGDRKKSRIRADAMPIAGTRLIREWQGVEHVVTVTADGFEWQGRPYKSLSAIARAITGTRWNGLGVLWFAEPEDAMTEP